jgi:mycothiol synthase
VPHRPTGADAPPGAGDEGPLITVTGPLAEAAAARVLRLAGAAAERDAVGPLSEPVLLYLRYGGGPQSRNLLLTPAHEPARPEPAGPVLAGPLPAGPVLAGPVPAGPVLAGPVPAGPVLAGYGHLDPADQADPAEGPAAELVIHPDYRGRGFGLALARALLAEAAPHPLRVWAHGDLPAARALAARAGFARIRSLWTMHRPLADLPAVPAFPPGVTLRTFSAGADEAAWLNLNRRAFAHHPEQGAWTAEDLSLREREPWFDPDGFFLAERDGKLAGFHWTKIHGTADNGNPAAGHEPIGEVYVVGVDPAGQGGGLGRALTLAGLHYLRSRGLPEVMLYVDEDNTPAIRLYESLGFAHQGTDVMFRYPAGG